MSEINASQSTPQPTTPDFKVLALTLFALLALFGCTNDSATLAEQNQAGLVVFHGDGSVKQVCVTFSESRITGLELIKRSGIPYVATYFTDPEGYAICQLDGYGCADQTDCFCDSLKSWGLYTLEQGQWKLSNVDVSNEEVMQGTVHAWLWGENETPPARVITFDACCGGSGR